MKSIKEYLTEEMVRMSAFYLSRASMPQIQNLEKFQDWFEEKGIRTDKLMVVTSIVKPVQSDFDQTKVDKIKAERPSDGVQKKPIVTDEDYYILDGHHRYFANLQDNERETWLVKVDLPINKLLHMAYQYKEEFPDG